TVIHAEGRMAEGKDSVNETDLNEFIEIAKTIGVYRLKDFDGSLISKAALEYIGYPFDWNFNLAEEDKLYCTELLYVIVKKITPDIQLQRVFQKELNREIIPLEAISKSEYFDEILFIN
ncbi:MAG: hypothetical protein FWB73_07585, partial [Treponema sp.]|nr:hypothetical protein [Treponema sp.]